MKAKSKIVDYDNSRLSSSMINKKDHLIAKINSEKHTYSTCSTCNSLLSNLAWFHKAANDTGKFLIV